MRVLVRCSECSRQLDAGGLEAGAHFRCPCGAVVTVPSTKAHSASVVRCSSCGATREKDAPNCSFCNSDFTLHEQDLHTMCPSCFARISNRARFCHHCATEIIPQGKAGELTSKPCPACGDEAHLASRKLSTVRHAVLECDRCAGMWLEHDLLQSVVRAAKDQAVPSELQPRSAGSSPLKVTRRVDVDTNFYRPCPECGQRMMRKNWAQRSGVIVDVCSAHGIWFDTEELENILKWVRDGGLERARAERAQSLPPLPSTPTFPPPMARRYLGSSGGGWLGSVLEVLLWVGLDVLLD